MVGKTIVGVIDILGYKSLVDKYRNKIGYIRELEESIKYSTVHLRNEFEVPTFNTKNVEDYYNILLDVVKIRFISDTAVFTLPNINLSRIKKEELTGLSHCIFIYLLFIERFCLNIISKTGCVVRGGISIGFHYENDFNCPGNLFIFSEGYIRAYDLEKNEQMARIVIDDRLWSY